LGFRRSFLFVLLNQLGLELVATNLPVEMLVIESTKTAK